MKISTIKEILNTYAERLSGEFGAYFKDLNTGESCGINTDKVFPTASMAKTFVLAEMMKLADEGKLDLDAHIEFTESMKSPGSGVLSGLVPGFSLTVRDYALLMMNISDNAAADICLDLVGSERILNDIIKPFNLTKTQINADFKGHVNVYCGLPEDTPADRFQAALAERRVKDSSFTLRNYEPFLKVLDKDNVSSPEEFGKLLELFYNGQWVSRKVSDDVLNIMKQCQTNSRIPKFLPPSVVVAHKTGTIDRLVNDGGIIYTRKGDYILTMFYNGNTASEEEYKMNNKGFYGDAGLANISLDIFKEYIH